MAKPHLTATDMRTIRTAISYAVQERESYMDAIRDSDPVVYARAAALVKRFETLHDKLFGEPSDHAQQKAQDAAAPTVSIFEIMKRV